MSAGLVFSLGACEDIINPTLQPASPMLVVDAWLTNRPEPQVISITRSQPYFEKALPPGVPGAQVRVVDNQGTLFIFLEDVANAGKYVWTPPPGQGFGVIGGSYRLTLVVNGETFEASSYMGRVPPIDSITFETDNRLGTSEKITRAEFWATDPTGIGDAYWIRTSKNGIALLKPTELNIAFDAGLSIGGQTDGVTFITPVRRRINANDKDANDKALSPIVSGDSIQVQIHSITVQAFTFLTEVGIQTNRPGGFQELFATPLANVSTNVVNTTAGGSKVLGFFNVSAVSSAGKRFSE
ncbi:MAG: DUF4249 domain-containing protein [Cytophagales bacterium]|nr:DUF4249 domain-containing protein [Cytophagales bacterium]